MATVREGNRPALVVVDVQVGVMAEAWDADRVVANVARAVDRARDADVPVVWVQHADDEMPRGSEQRQLVPALVPADGEPLVHKAFNSSFADTDLEERLAERGVSHVVLAGAATNWCVRATAYGALDLGYDLTLVADGHTTGSMPMGDGRTIEASDIVDELNVCVRWLTYPGRRTAVAPAEAVAF